MSKEKEVSRSNNMWKWLTLLVVAVGSAYLIYPTEKNPDGSLKSKIRYGLDLNGGSSFTLGVDTDQLKNNLIEKYPEEKLDADAEALEKRVEETLEGADERIVEVIRRRIDSMGTSEPLIQPVKGKHQILVQIPGAKAQDRDEARARLERMAYLEFRLVPQNESELISRIPEGKAPPGYKKYGSGYVREDNWTEISKSSNYVARLSNFAVASVKSSVPVRFILQRDKENSKVFQPRFVLRKSELDGNSLTSASVSPADDGGFQINFKLNDEGAAKFGKLTGANKGRQLAIILDDELLSAPVIQSKITSSGQITGNFKLSEAKRLAADLNAGALPAPLKIEAESTVDPTVGQDAISRGKWAALIGFALVAVFMLFYYWYVGAIADVALILDVFLLPAALFLVANLLSAFVDPSVDGSGAFQLPVLTMPGIAGLVLTLGMAVDANVLIFERIREEFSRGATVGKAVENGYSRAFTAILDSNLTTIITGCILYSVGTGPVRGFAIMLTGGVVISMFTALVVTRLVIDHTSNPADVKPFKMRQFFKAPKIDFMKYGKKTLAISGVIIVLTIGLFTYRLFTNPQKVLALDLTGGTSISFSVDEKDQPKMADLRNVLEKFDNAVQIQYGKSVEGDRTTLLVKTGRSEETAQSEIREALAKDFPQLVYSSSEYIGAAVGEDLKKSGTQAVLFSLVAILVYIAFRFRFGFGLGGLVALAHDALIALGIFSLLGHQVSLIVITALLTIVGYSINDTVVVFDRIREMLKYDKRMSFTEVCNAAINSCLSRTVITSVTTFFAVAALFLFGEGSIYDFALTMLIGVVAGTYSSIFIATPIMAWWYKFKRPDLDDDEGEKGEEKASR